jgi:hypothetical protein
MAEAEVTEGVPLITPVVGFNNRPEGKAGSIE